MTAQDYITNRLKYLRERMPDPICYPSSFTTVSALIAELSGMQEQITPCACAGIPDPETTIPQLVEALREARELVQLVTIRQVLSGGDKAVLASGLNPWCVNEGQATGNETLGTYRIDALLSKLTPTKEAE